MSVVRCSRGSRNDSILSYDGSRDKVALAVLLHRKKQRLLPLRIYGLQQLLLLQHPRLSVCSCRTCTAAPELFLVLLLTDVSARLAACSSCLLLPRLVEV
ncbi:hypothetical protein cyc_07424 [Cyclospora cayetanensis]|uniref:Uncharacterized protein n=1 Tax=Cyclospora cayetanensis TaxID=88456 RepID=A0A1D3CTT6_9EIME|nr:hypothetical protein cyc_07424 [Cyclospora cayetanensis]